MTIIIPAYNCSKTIGRTLQSLVNQTNKNFHVLIVDDCSTEDLSLVVNDYINLLNISVVKTPYNQGCGGARQKGIETIGISDDYISFLDADDILLPRAIELWQQNTVLQPDIIYSHILIKRLSNRIVPFPLRAYGPGTFMTHGKVYSTQFLLKHNIYSDIKVRYSYNDYFLNHQALNYTENIVFINEPTYLYIQTAGSVSLDKSITQNQKDEMYQYVRAELIKIFNKKNIEYHKLYRKNEHRILNNYHKNYCKLSECCKDIKI